VGAAGTAQAQEAVREEAALEKGLELIPDEPGQGWLARLGSACLEATQFRSIQGGESSLRAGAASVVLQPPRIAGIDEATLLRFFGTVIDAAGIPARRATRGRNLLQPG